MPNGQYVASRCLLDLFRAISLIGNNANIPEVSSNVRFRGQSGHYGDMR